MQGVQDQNHCNVGKLNTVRREASRQFRDIKKDYLKAEIEELETTSKIKKNETLL